MAEAHGIFSDRQAATIFLGSQRFDPDGCFIAEENGSLVGCVAVTRLPREHWMVVRYLAVSHLAVRTSVVNKLLGEAVQFAKSKSVEFLRATTPAIEPYVNAYKEYLFRPVRSDFRISWDLTLEAGQTGPQSFKIDELTSDRLEQAAKAYVESLSPLWDWRTEELGGSDAVAKSFIDGVRAGELWLTCTDGVSVAGLAGISLDYGPGVTRFRGAYVLPEFRGKGMGTALINSVKDMARKMGQQKMVVYTFSYLDSLAPGALLYLKTGGKIEAEYLQLQLPETELL